MTPPAARLAGWVIVAPVLMWLLSCAAIALGLFIEGLIEWWRDE